MYTTLLFIVLFERAVAVEFSVETQEKNKVYVIRLTQTFHTLTMNLIASIRYNTDNNKSLRTVTFSFLFLHTPHDVVVDLHERRRCVQPTEICIYHFN